MKTKFTFLLLLLLFTSNSKMYGQSANFETMFCKEWKLVNYEENGNKFPPTPEQKNDRMTFYVDHKVKSIEVGKMQNGTWKYDAATKLLSVTDKETNQVIVLTVLKLTNEECVLEAKYPEGGNLKMYMVPANS